MVKLKEIFLEKINENKDLNKREKKLFVGVDIGRLKNQVAFLSKDRNAELRKREKIENSFWGFMKLLEYIEELIVQESITMENVIIGIESTGHYWKNLYNFFLEKNIEVVMVKNKTVKLKREIKYPYKGKNDSLDSVCIALSLKDDDYIRIRKSNENYDSLRILSKIKDERVKANTQNKNRIIKWLDKHNQIYLKTFVDPYCKTGMALLKCFPGEADIKEKTVEEVIEILRSNNNKNKLQYRKISEYYELLIDILNDIKEIPIGARKEIENLIRLFEDTENYLETLQKDIDELSNEMELPVERFSQLKGLGKNEILDLISEIGMIENYKTSKHLQAYCGLRVIAYKSGEYQIKKPKISKAGNRKARRILFHMALILIARNPDWRKLFAYYLSYNRENQKSKKEMLIAVASKLCRTIFGMLKNDTEFDRKLLFRGLDFSKCNKERFINEYVGEKRNWVITDEELEELFGKSNTKKLF